MLKFITIGADIQIILVVISEVGALKGPVFTPGFINHRNMRGDPALFDQPIQSVMSKAPVTVPAGSKTMVAIETLACRNLSELPVVDPMGRAIGLIDITDVVNVSRNS